MKNSLKEILRRAHLEGWAVPHFNISDLAMLKGVVEAAKEMKSPLLVGTSEKESDFLGREETVALIAALRRRLGLDIFLNADHCRSVETAIAAVDAGYDAVHIDLSKLPLADNIVGTKKAVAYARAKNPDISVEGEVGYLVTDSSRIYTEAITVPPESLASVAEAKRFVEETGVDRLAPAVGTVHGIAANQPHISLERISELHQALKNTILVLHGGSGVDDEQIKQAIGVGIANIHISTEIRLAYASALREFVINNPEETTPYQILAPAVEAVRRKAVEKIKLLGAAGRV